jgi:catecholate siderophore receptor
MKARDRRRKKKRAATPWFVLGAMVGTIPQLHAADLPKPVATPPAERRVIVDPRVLHASLAHVRIWTPSETLPVLAWSETPVQSAAPQPQPLTFEIPPGTLDVVLKAYEKITGITIAFAEEGLRTLPSPGVSGVRTADQALRALLTGTSVSYRFTSPTTAVVEIRLASDAVQVSGTLPHVESAKYAAPLKETPQTIQVIPRALLDEQGATTLTDALRNVPGITMQAGEGGGASNTSGDMFNMRGFSANNSLFVDGVRDDGMLARDVFNLEQIEVFSGPTGSDVGRTNAAGYINLTTKSPNLGSARSASLSYGSQDQVRTTFDVNQPLSLGEEGTLLGNAAVRLNVLWQDGGIAGRDYAGRESKAIAPSIAFGLDTPTRVSVGAQIMRQDNLADYGLPAAASPIGPLTPTSAIAARPVDQATYFGSPDFDYDHVEQDNVTARIEHDVTRNVTLRNQTRYNTTTREAVISTIQNAAAYNPATNQVTVSRQANERQNDIWSNQTNLTARAKTGSLHHDLSVGMEITGESQFAPTLTGVGTRAPIDLNNPDVFSPVVGMNIVPTGAWSEGNTDTVAFYLFDGVDLTPRVRATGGVRVEHYNTKSHSVTAAGVPTDLDGEGTLVSGKAGVVVRLNEQGNLYVSYGSSLTPPGSANFQLNAAPGNQNNPNVDPQESTNYEVGSKWDVLGNRLQIAGAFFHTENKNVIFVVDPNAVPPIFNQDDEQRVRGIALSAVGQLRPWWDVNFSVQYLDSESRSQNLTNNGRRLQLTPEFSGSVWSTVRLPHNVRVGGGVRYNDLVFVNAANTILVPSYAVADALIEAPIGQRLTLRLNIYNVTDKVYIRNINNNGARYNPGTPRSFLLSSAVRF